MSACVVTAGSIPGFSELGIIIISLFTLHCLIKFGMDSFRSKSR